MGSPLTLTISAYKRLRHIRNVIQAITDSTSQGADVKKEVVINLLVQLGEEISLTIEQIERDTRHDST